MIILLSSNDRYSISNYINETAQKLDVKPIFFSGTDKLFSLDDVYFEAITLDIFEATKFIVIQDALFLSSKEKLSTEDEERLKEIIKISDEITIVFTLFNYKFDNKKKSVKLLKEAGQMITLEEVKSLTIKQVLAQQNKKHQLGLSQEALVKLEQMCPNLEAAHQAIEKLKLIDGHISIDLMELLVDDRSDHQIFELSNAIIEKNMSETYRLMASMKQKSFDTSGITYVLASKIRQIYQSLTLSKYGYQQAEIAKMLGISPNYAWVLINKLNRLLRTSDCLEILSSLSQLDRKSKTYMIDKELEFDLWLIDYWRKYGKSKRII